jgi:hypothetical protein
MRFLISKKQRTYSRLHTNLLNAYIAYASNKMGNLQDAAKYYSNLAKYG